VFLGVGLGRDHGNLDLDGFTRSHLDGLFGDSQFGGIGGVRNGLSVGVARLGKIIRSNGKRYIVADLVVNSTVAVVSDGEGLGLVLVRRSVVEAEFTRRKMDVLLDSIVDC
jgi:hypothetical protein